MASLILAEQREGVVKPSAWACLNAAKKFNQPITALIIGPQSQLAAQTIACFPGLVKVYYVDAPLYTHSMAVQISEILLRIAHGFTHIMATATSLGKEVMPRVAAALDVAQISDITAIVADDTFVRPIYAGSVLATVHSLDTIKVLTIRQSAFATAFTQQANPAEVEALNIQVESTDCIWLEDHFAPTTRPDLTSANIVIAGGRGLQKAENFKLLEDLADRLHAALGATRAAVDAGFVGNDYQIGQTGKVVAPDLYIAIGISGAIQHLAGMKESKVIVAINKDPDAPILQIADYIWVTDLFIAIPELLSALQEYA